LSSRHVYFVLAGLTAMILFAVFHSVRAGVRFSTYHGPLADAAMGIKLDLTTAHLRFEEILGGDRQEGMADVWRYLDMADAYADAMLEGGRTPKGTSLRVRDSDLRAPLEKLRRKLVDFREITAQRYEAWETYSSGPQIDQLYHAKYEELMQLAGEVDDTVREGIRRDMARFWANQMILIAGLLLLSVLSGVTVAKYIAGRKRAEQTLRLTQFSVDRAADAAFWMGPDARFLYVNDKACRSLGYAQEELLTMTVHDIDPDFPQGVWADHWRELKERGSFTIESHHRSKEGRVFPVEVTVNYVEFEGMEYNCAFVRDITDRKKAEAELLELKQHERELVEAELEKVRGELVRSTRLATIGQMSAQIAHDIRNPLGAVHNAVYYLRRKVPQGEEKWHEYLEMIRKEINACDRIITSLLDVARRRKPVREPHYLCEVVQRAMSRMVLPHDVRLSCRCRPNPFLLHVDAVQWRQVMDNLLKNAVEAVSPRGDIAVAGECVGEYDVVTVQDSGPGIEPEMREKIFDMFITTKAKGTGLGLSICRQIVERHGGTLELLDNGQPGAAFQIRLPRGDGDDRERGAS